MSEGVKPSRRAGISRYPSTALVIATRRWIFNVVEGRIVVERMSTAMTSLGLAILPGRPETKGKEMEA